MNKHVFVIGRRRGGTSIMRELVAKHPEVIAMEFEPHHLWAAVDLSHFKRLMNHNIVKNFTLKIINNFNVAGGAGKWYGAKFALNPGTKALEWVWLSKTFPNAKFIFITRNIEHTWASVYKQDAGSVRGIIDKQSYITLSKALEVGFYKFEAQDPTKGLVCSYEALRADPDVEMGKVWKLLGLPPIGIDLRQFMRRPENA